MKNNSIKLALESKKIRLVDINRIDDAKLAINLLHTNDDANFALCKKYKDSKFSQWMLNKNELMHKISNVLELEDVYFSLNSFCSVRRRIRDLYSLNGFIVDLDYYKCAELANKNVEYVIDFLRQKGLFDKLEPSHFIYSGNGMYIVYLIENAHAKSCLKIWKKIMNILYTMFEQYGADNRSLDASHVFRLPGTVNTKTGNISRFIYNSDKDFKFEQQKEEIKRYTLTEIADALLPQLPYSREEYKRIKAERKAAAEKKLAERNNSSNNSSNNSNKVKHIYNLYTLNLNRMKDLADLVNMRHGYCRKNGVLSAEGSREYILFLYRYFNILCFHNIEKSLNDTLELNKKFAEQLSDDEVILSTKNVVDQHEKWQEAYKLYNQIPQNEKPKIGFFFHRYCYTFKNSTIIQQLEITKEEMQKLRTIKTFNILTTA